MSVFSGARLRAEREAHQLSREVLAVRTGRSVSGITKFETDQIAPSAATLGRLAAAIGCDVGAFFVKDTVGGAA